MGAVAVLLVAGCSTSSPTSSGPDGPDASAPARDARPGADRGPDRDGPDGRGRGGPDGPTTAPGRDGPAANPEPTEPSEPREPREPRPEVGTAFAALRGLDVGPSRRAGSYDRDAFGSDWLDVDTNGCDTREDVLRRDLRRLVLETGTSGCVVLRGVLRDPYTRARIAFTRGETTSTDVQVDHVVALSDAWRSGAAAWSDARREAFANDPLELLAVDGPTNLSKGDGATDTWLPPSRRYHCAYVARQVTVKAEYGLSVTRPEARAMRRVLRTCPARGLAGPGRIRLGGGVERPATDVATPPPPTRPGPSDGGLPFENCDAAEAAGATPVLRGDPGYGSWLDADGDGVACE